MTTIYKWQDDNVDVSILPGDPGIFRVMGNIVRSRDGGPWELVDTITHDEPVTKTPGQVASAVGAVAENIALADSNLVDKAAQIENILETADPLEY